MTNKIGIYDHNTGEQIVREMTPEEQAAYEAEAAASIERKAKREAELAAAKQSLLDKLGLTEEEAKLLLG